MSSRDIKMELGKTFRVSSMNRRELLEALQECEIWEERMSSFPIQELAEILKEFQLAQMGGSEVDREIHRLGRLKKQDLILAVEGQITLTGNETIGAILRKMRARLDELQPEASGLIPDQEMGFGKHHGKWYSQVKELHPDYCQWARVMHEEDPQGVHRTLAKFVRWLHQSAQTQEENPPSTATSSRVKEEPRETPVKAKQKATAVKSKAQPKPKAQHYRLDAGWIQADGDPEIVTEEEEEEVL